MSVVIWRRVGGSAVYALLALAFVLAGSIASGAEKSKTDLLWFDPTQLPSFTGTVDRFLPTPDGKVDRLVFKEGPQIVFPPDAYEALREVASKGQPLVVWGIRARHAAVITMLAYGPPEGEPTVLDRFYWRPEPVKQQGRRDIMLIGKVWKPYLSPQGQAAGAILENGDVIRVDPSAAGQFHERLAEGARIVAAGPGVETPLGKAIDADRIGETVDKLEPVPRAHPDTHTGGGRPTR
jgi:hypothetical protein